MNEQNNFYDVIVVGSGPAGSMAALQAARAGAKTLLLEKNSLPGGTTTVCGVNFPGLFHAWGQQVISGIGWELASRTVAEGHGVFPDFSRYDLPHWQLQIRINASLYACLLDEAFIAAGVKVLYHAMPLAARESDDGVAIQVATKEGSREFRSLIAIDATGDADLIAMAGFPLRKSEENQPATPIIRLSGYDPNQLDLENIEVTYREAVKNGLMNYLDTGMSRSIAHLLRCHGENCVHVPSENALTSAGKSMIEQNGRATVLRIYRFLRQFPGLEHIELEYMAPQCGIRETAVIEGDTIITVDDYVSGRCWNDSLCYTFYPLDLHRQDKESGLLGQPLKFGVVPTVPRSALTPRGSRRLLAAGRCVSSDRLANSALRVQASCMAMGQVAGALAALATQQRQCPRELELGDVKALLRRHKALVP